MTVVVLAHVHDAEAGVYRLVLGREVTAVQVVRDEEGAPVYATADPDERSPDEQPLTEQVVTGHDIVGDYAWAAHDDRWKGKGPAKIADEQVALAEEALAAQDAAAREAEAAAAAATTSLPTVGRTLREPPASAV